MYTAEMGGSSYPKGPKAKFATVKEARAWAESHGDTADWCNIYKPSRSRGQGLKLVASHRRDPNGDGMSWYRSVLWPI